jgi:hypothetical protein
MNDTLLRYLALIGMGLLTIGQFFSTGPLGFNQIYDYYVLYLTAAAVGAALFIFQKAAFKLFRNPDVFIPAGIYLVCSELFGLLLSVFPGHINFQNGGVSYEGIPAMAVVGSVGQILLATVFAGWQTLTILQLVRNEKIELAVTLRRITEWFPGTFAAMAFGWSPVYLLFGILTITIYTGAAGNLDYAAFLTFWTIFIGMVSLFWNLLTFLLVPYILESEKTIGEALKRSFGFGAKYIRKIAFPVILQMTIIGWIMFVAVSYVEKAEFGENSRTVMTTSFETTLLWTGGFPTESKWEKKVLKIVGAEEIPAVEFRMMLLLLLLVLVIKIQIFTMVWGDADEVTGFVDDFGSGALAALLLAGLYLLPFEQIYGGFVAGKSSAFSASVENNRYFEKELFFEIPENETLTPAGGKPVKLDFRGINDIATIDIKGRREIIVLSGRDALVIDRAGKVLEIVNFELPDPPDGDFSNHYYPNGEIIDIDGDGAPEYYLYNEFLGKLFGALPQVIIDGKGRVIWRSVTGDKLEKEKDQSGLLILAAGRQEPDKLPGLFVVEKERIRPFDRERDGKSEGVFYNNLEIFENETGKLLALNKSSRSVLKNLSAEPVSRSKRSYNGGSVLLDRRKRPLNVYFDGEQAGLFDFEGRLVKKYPAPAAEVDYGFFESWKRQYADDREIIVFDSLGKFFDTNKVALYAMRSGASVRFSGRLYIYDDTKLMLEDTFEEMVSLRLHREKTDTGSENLLVVDGDRVWRYRKK